MRPTFAGHVNPTTNVGLIRFTTADGRFGCSGTLISPKVVSRAFLNAWMSAAN